MAWRRIEAAVGMSSFLVATLLLLSCDDGDGGLSSDTTSAEIPSLELCDPIREWNPELVQLEQEMLEALEARRAVGQSCGPRGSYPPAPRLRVDGALTCAARLHALDMAEQGFVAHEGSDGTTPWARLRAAEYPFATADEVIVSIDLPPEDILDTIWLPREGSCAALSASSYIEVGVGAALPFDPEDPLTGLRWAIVLAKPIE